MRHSIWKTCPDRVLVVGGGYIAVEFAGIFNGYGAETTQVYRGDKILRGFDDDVRVHLAAEMEKKGINIVWNTIIDRIDKVDGGLDVTMSNGECINMIRCSMQSAACPIPATWARRGRCDAER